MINKLILTPTCFFSLSLKIVHRFCRLEAEYGQYLSKHIIKILEQKPKLYEQCKPNFKQILTLDHTATNAKNTKDTHLQQSSAVSAKLNMIFRIYSLPEVLNGFKEELCSMVATGTVKTQSDVDRIASALTKKIKMNKQVTIGDIEKEAESDRLNFQTEIQQIKDKGGSIIVNQVSKSLRDKYLTIDSRQIYERLKQISSSATNSKSNSEIKQSQNEITHTKSLKAAHQFWHKLSNIKPRLLPQECNDPTIYAAHIAYTKNRLHFRFPPEPNGYLHIGHIKSIRINFETAKQLNGFCYLRYDDTNPETQSHEYIENILKNVRWLGYEPDRITYASDYFEEMIQFAMRLIKEGHAYVCDSEQIEVEKQRKDKQPNKYRDRSIQQSLSMFPNLKEGQTLRLKLNPAAKNPTLRDPIIYRIKNHPHPRTGNKHRIYPIYDFAHCICDSLEHIDYSLCSLEFEVRRQLYYKILELLKLYKPTVWEYSRLNVQGSVISKRKIKSLIESQSIASWSDARLLTIGGLINRGYTPSMLLSFIDKVNASRAGNQNVVQFSLLEKQMRKQLFPIAEKAMIVLDPKLVQIQSQKSNQNEKFTEMQISTDPQKKYKRKIKYNNEVYIQKSEDLTVGKIIVLKYLGAFQVKSADPPFLSKFNEQISTMKTSKIAFKILHWASTVDTCQIPVVLYDRLLDSQNKVNSNSRLVIQKCIIPKHIYEQKGDITKYWQMERLGYFKFGPNGEFFRCTTLQ